MAGFKQLDDKFQRSCKIKKKLEENKCFLNKELGSKFSLERAVDLFCNARRRAAEAKYDDAVARLYRLTEFLIQIEAHSLGILAPESFEVDPKKISAELVAKYNKLKNCTPQTLQLPLIKLLELLIELPEFPGSRKAVLRQTKEEHKKFLGLRNRSILAHGFNYLSKKEYEEFENIVHSYATKLHPEFQGLVDKFVIPEIDYEEVEIDG